MLGKLKQVSLCFLLQDHFSLVIQDQFWREFFLVALFSFFLFFFWRFFKRSSGKTELEK